MASGASLENERYYTEEIRFPAVTLAVCPVDDYTKRKPICPVYVCIKGKFLFSWDDVPGIMEVLKSKYGIGWVKRATVEKTDAIIRLTDEKKYIYLEFDSNKKKVNVRIDDGRRDELAARSENDTLNIYEIRKISPIKNLSKYYVFTDISAGSYIVGIKSDAYFDEEIKADASRLKALEGVELEFETSGPSKNATNARLKDASRLMIDDVVEFINPDNKIEQRRISAINADNKTISWKKKLENDFKKKYSRVHVLKYLAVPVFLKPRPSYPFPDIATLMRGCIINPNPVAGATVKVEGTNFLTFTDKKGEFVLYFVDKTDKITIKIENEIEVFLLYSKTILGKTVSMGKISF